MPYFPGPFRSRIVTCFHTQCPVVSQRDMLNVQTSLQKSLHRWLYPPYTIIVLFHHNHGMTARHVCKAK
jgi:hypothetical protein